MNADGDRVGIFSDGRSVGLRGATVADQSVPAVEECWIRKLVAFFQKVIVRIHIISTVDRIGKEVI